MEKNIKSNKRSILWLALRLVFYFIVSLVKCSSYNFKESPKLLKFAEKQFYPTFSLF